MIPAGDPTPVNHWALNRMGGDANHDTALNPVRLRLGPGAATFRRNSATRFFPWRTWARQWMEDAQPWQVGHG